MTGVALVGRGRYFTHIISRAKKRGKAGNRRRVTVERRDDDERKKEERVLPYPLSYVHLRRRSLQELLTVER
jgi:hypothetical protein